MDHREGALARAQLLIDRDRPAEARKVLGAAMASSPNDPELIFYTAVAFHVEGDNGAALQWCTRVIPLAPTNPTVHRLHGEILSSAGRYRDAEGAMMQAVELDPNDPASLSAHALILLQLEKPEAALKQAKAALAVDPESETALTARSVALTQLGRADEAQASLDDATRIDPNSANVHTSRGWAALHRGRPKDALPAFREALRLQPGMEWARAGMIEALKARNPIYRYLLEYFLWMSRIGHRARMFVVIGTYIGYQVVRQAAASIEPIQFIAVPLMVAWFGFVYLTWTGPAVFNLLLRIDKHGRHVLDAHEKRASTIYGLMLLAALLSGVMLLFLPLTPLFIFAVMLLVMTIPVSACLSVKRWQKDWQPKAAWGFVAMMATLGCVAVIGAGIEMPDLMGASVLGFIGAFVAFSFGFNFIASKPD